MRPAACIVAHLERDCSRGLEYHLSGLIIALGLLGLGYGIRYGSSACLYVAMAICAGLSLYCGVLVVSGWTPYYMLRLALSAWAFWRLYRAIPAMRLLQQEGAFPLPMSRYGELFLRQRIGKTNGIFARVPRKRAP